MTILALAWVSSAIGWAMAESRGQSSLALRLVFAANIVFHPVVCLIAWKRWQPLRVVDMACLVFAASICALCMALRLYAPVYGARIDLEPLYLWIPVIYVFAFTLMDHKSSLKLSLLILALFVGIGLPYLVLRPDAPHGNFTVQLYMVSAILIAALYFFSSYQHRFQIAQLSASELARLANTDELTQLANRRSIAETVSAELARFERYGGAFSLVLIDMDHFKTVNDQFGHAVGDQALVALAARAQEVLRDADTLGRWGGEEFIVLMPETAYIQALQKASSLCRHVAAQPLVGDHTVSISCGVTTVAHGDTADVLLQRADTALYAAKHGGRNRAEGLLFNAAPKSP